MRPRRPAAVLLLAASLACDGGEEELEIPRPTCPDQVNADFELRQPDSGILGATGIYWDAPAEVRFSSAVDGCVTWSFYFSEAPADPRNKLDVGVVRSDDTGAMTIPGEDFNGWRPSSRDTLRASLERVHSATAETEHGCGTFEIRSAVRIEIQSE